MHLLTPHEQAMVEALRIRCWELYHIDLADYFAVIDAQHDPSTDTGVLWN